MTLAFTARANKAATLAAQAAIDAVGSERAWLSYADPLIEQGRELRDGKDVGQLLALSMLIKNTGRSPALNVRLDAEAQIISPGDPRPVFSLKDNHNNGSVIGPQIEYNSHPYVITGDNCTDFLESRKIVAYYLRATYETMWAPGVQHVTEACGLIICDGYAINKNGNVEPRTRFAPSGPQNTAT